MQYSIAQILAALWLRFTRQRAYWCIIYSLNRLVWHSRSSSRTSGRRTADKIDKKRVGYQDVVSFEGQFWGELGRPIRAQIRKIARNCRSFHPRYSAHACIIMSERTVSWGASTLMTFPMFPMLLEGATSVCIFKSGMLNCIIGSLQLIRSGCL